MPSNYIYESFFFKDDGSSHSTDEKLIEDNQYVITLSS